MSASPRMTSRTSATSSGSRALVTSSRSRMSGCIASARTIATRCCCPPDSRSGTTSRLSARPNRASSASASASACARFWPRTCRGASVTLSMTVMCGKRLNAWKTMPIRRRMRLMSTPWAVISSPSTMIRPDIDGLQQVDAAEQRGLAGARRADEAHDLVLRDGEVDAAQDLERAERLVQALDPERLAGLHQRCPPCAPLRRSRATSQSVNRASGIVTTMKIRATATIRREVERGRLLDLRPDGRSRRRRSTRRGPCPSGGR